MGNTPPSTSQKVQAESDEESGSEHTVDEGGTEENVNVVPDIYPVYTVVEAFPSTTERDLDLVVGNKIAVFWKENDLLWNGKNLHSQKIGWFPAKCVRMDLHNVDIYNARKSAKLERLEIVKVDMGYEAKSENEISVKDGDLVAVLSKSGADLWHGTNLNSLVSGWFVPNRVTLICLREPIRNAAFNVDCSIEAEMKQWVKEAKRDNTLITRSRLSTKTQIVSRKLTNYFIERYPDLVEAGSDSSPNINNSLTPDEESELVEWIQQMSTEKKSVTYMDIRQRATDIVKRRNPNRKLFSKGWIHHLKSRHPEIGPLITFESAHHSKSPNRKRLTDKEEQEIVEWVKSENSAGRIPTRRETIKYGNESLKRQNPDAPPLTIEWCILFCIRHPEIKIQAKKSKGAALQNRHFTEEEEDELVKWIDKRNRDGKPPSKQDFRERAERMLIEKGAEKSDKQVTVGDHFFNAFMLRHPELEFSKKKLSLKRQHPSSPGDDETVQESTPPDPSTDGTESPKLKKNKIE